MSDGSTKICPRCLRLERPAEHPRSHFGPNRMTKDGLQHVCRRCASETVKETRERQRRERDHEKASMLAIAEAGMTSLGEVVPPAAGGNGLRYSAGRRLPGGYEALFRAQRGACAICRQPEVLRDVDGTVLPLTLYHSGRARGGSVRGLLCRACTTALVFFRDSPVLLARAMAFLTAAMDEGPLLTARAEVQH